MSTLLAGLLVLYGAIGIVIYAVTDTRRFTSKVESLLVIVPYGIVSQYLFFFVVVLWPFWLIMYSREKSF